MTLPDPPRPPTTAASAASWAETPVRVWMVLLIALVIAIAVVIGESVSRAARDADLERRGVAVDAIVEQIDGDDNIVNRPRDTPRSVRFRYTLPDNPAVLRLTGRLPAGQGLIARGQTLTIRVVPGENVWAEGSIGGNLLSYLAMPLALLVPTAAAAGLMLLQRASVLRLYQRGLPRTATVVGVQRTPLAPSALQLRVKLDGDDGRVFNVLHPARLGKPREGDAVQLLCDPNQPTRAIVAAAYA